MGRRSHSRHLVVWLNGIPVGEWDAAPASTSFTYFPQWIANAQGRPLSLSMPFTPNNAPYRGALVSNYFDNMLPDSDAIRRRLAQRFQSGGVAPFQLLAAIGRDCVGAVQLLPRDEAPTDLFSITGQILTERGIAQLLRATTSATSLGRDEDDIALRLSIAGAQEKNALLWHQGQWRLPSGNTPTTHIFKLPLGLVGNMQADMGTSVENEWLCSNIARAFGLSAAHCEIASFEDQKALIVERFDRKLSADASWIVRLPQEDFCQATGASPLQKYQADGGPGIARIMDVLLGSQQGPTDRRNFFKTQLVFWLLAATDGHAKNFSIFHLPGGQYRATPLYDILSAHPILGKGNQQLSPKRAKLAMAVRGSANHYQLDQIQRRHWVTMAQQVGLGERAAQEMIEEVLAAAQPVVDAMSTVLPPHFPHEVAESILDGMLTQSKKLQAMRA